MIKPVELSQEDCPITFSPRALEVAKTALSESEDKKDEFLRVSVQGGGCAGMQYALNFVSGYDQYDQLIEFSGLKVLVDIFSSVHLTGTSIEYTESLKGAGFEFKNPNAKTTCGCGSSFS